MQAKDIEMVSMPSNFPRQVSFSEASSKVDLAISSPPSNYELSEATIDVILDKESSAETENPPKKSKSDLPTTSSTQKKEENKQPERMSWKHYFLHVMSPIWHSFPNKVSEARDMLAAERTALSWQRTAYAILAIGIGVSRLNRKDRDPFVPKALGVVTAVIALLLIMYAHLRFHVVMKSMVDRK